MVYGPDIVTGLSAVTLFPFLVDGLWSRHCDWPAAVALMRDFFALCVYVK